jgi:threonyl-tRNA synthetase
MLVTGDREAAENTVSVRSRSAGDLGARPVSAFIADAQDAIARKDLGATTAPAAEQQPA